MAILKIYDKDTDTEFEVPIEDPTLYMRHDGTVVMTGSLNMGANAITNVGNVDGVDVSAHASRHTNGSDDIQSASGLFKGLMSAASFFKLANIETLADVTDAANVAAAGAIMDSDITGNGLMIRTGAGSYTNRSIAVADAKLTISNADGVSGNPTLGFGSVALADLSDGGNVVTAAAVITDNAVIRGDGGSRGGQSSGVLINDSDEMSGLTQLNVDNLRFDGNTISGTGGGNIILDPFDNSGVNVLLSGRVSVNDFAWGVFNSAWHASMVDTRTSLGFWQAYNSGGSIAEGARITMGTEGNWGVAATRNAYLALFTGFEGTATEYVRINSAGQVGIGTTDPGQYSSANIMLDIRRDGNRAGIGLYTHHNTTANRGSTFFGARSRGTLATPTIVQYTAGVGDRLFAFLAQGYDGSVFRSGANIIFTIDAAPALNAIPTSIEFWTGATSATLAERFRFQSDGNALFDSGTSVFIRDSALGFNSSVDGQLDIFGDTEVEITTPLIDLNAASIFASSLISGTDQADAGAAAGELYVDTNDDNTVKRGV